MDNKIKSSKDIEEITGLKSLISISNIKAISKKKLNIKNIRAHKSEIFKTLMTNIQFLNINNSQSKTILITSPTGLEGKTYISTNLAIEYAKAGKKVIIIDADMRRGRISKIFNLPNNFGFSNYLANLDFNGNLINERITKFINDTEIKNLNVITSGNVPPNPTELLKSPKVQELIKDLKVFYDVVIFDGVSVLEAPDSAILSKVCDLTVILSAYKNTKKESLKIAYKEINAAEGSVVGVAFNKIPERKFRKKLLTLKNNSKQKAKSLSNNCKKFSNKLKKSFFKILDGLKIVCGIFVGIGYGVKNVVSKISDNIKDKSNSIKEYIKNYASKREKIKLIEAGCFIVENDEKNIIKEVFDEEISKIEKDDNEIEFQKKLDKLKNNIDEKTENSVVENEKTTITTQNNAIKTKFDLMLEQQETKQTQVQIETEIEEKNKEQTVKVNKSVNQEKAREKEKTNTKIARNFEEVNFSNEEVLTEEMIRRQVEMDDMIRMAEYEESEDMKKLEEKMKKRKERKEKFTAFKQEKYEQFKCIIENIKIIKNEQDIKNAERQAILAEERLRKNEAKMEEKIKRENEKNENKARIAKVKEEKRAYREMEKQKHKEELRIRGELQEDNLYPKPKM